MLKFISKLLFSILQIIIVVSVLYGIGMSGDDPHSAIGKFYLFGFLGIVVWLLVSIFIARKVFEKFLSDSSQSLKVTKWVVAFSPVWIFPAIYYISFSISTLVKWCLDYYL